MLKSALNDISTPVATATGRLVIDEVCNFYEFRVLGISSQDIILGSDFQKANDAITDYKYDELILPPLPSYEAMEDVSLQQKHELPLVQSLSLHQPPLYLCLSTTTFRLR